MDKHTKKMSYTKEQISELLDFYGDWTRKSSEYEKEVGLGRKCASAWSGIGKRLVLGRYWGLEGFEHKRRIGTQGQQGLDDGRHDE